MLSILTSFTVVYQQYCTSNWGEMTADCTLRFCIVTMDTRSLTSTLNIVVSQLSYSINQLHIAKAVIQLLWQEKDLDVYLFISLFFFVKATFIQTSGLHQRKETHYNLRKCCSLKKIWKLHPSKKQLSLFRLNFSFCNYTLLSSVSLLLGLWQGDVWRLLHCDWLYRLQVTASCFGYGCRETDWLDGINAGTHWFRDRKQQQRGNESATAFLTWHCFASLHFWPVGK